MVADRIDAEADDLCVAFFEFWRQPGHVPEFGRANRREILGVGEQDRPATADPVMEIELPLCRLGREIGCFVVDAQRHRRASLCLMGPTEISAAFVTFPCHAVGGLYSL